MLERLKEALAECEAEQTAMEARDFETEVQAEVAEFEAQVRAKYETKKTEELRELSYQKKALNSLIEKEEKKLAEQATVSVPVQETEVLPDENV